MTDARRAGDRGDRGRRAGERRPVAVLGCTSNAGKSLLATALCRVMRRRGLRVAPFKAQNMSNNARVVTGGEIGVAQWLQARAAGVEPDVRMNPLLLKPEADDRSQVVLLGRPAPEISRTPWRDRAPLVWGAMADSLASLRAEYDLVVIEGAGSPAEINLPDLVNNRVVEHADAAAILVADIDRGGAFAHLVGTWTLVPDATRRRLRGFVLNRFRGDASLLAPAPQLVAERTSMVDLGVLPMLHHELPDEEGATVRRSPVGDAPTVAICRFPYGSNLDEFHLVAQVAHVRFVDRPRDVADADVVVVPGSKHVAADASWLRRTGLDRAIVERARRGGRTIGICGGCQLLGRRIDDPHGVEGATDGLALLDFVTEMSPEKHISRTALTVAGLDAPWEALNGLTTQGYEIRHGRIVELGHVAGNGAPATGGEASERRIWAAGPVLATTVHGLLEDPDVVAAVFGATPRPVLDETIDALADAVEQHLNVDRIVVWTSLDDDAANGAADADGQRSPTAP